jgi:hypothetical protein
LVLLGSFALAAGAFACNAILGIGAATVESGDGGGGVDGGGVDGGDIDGGDTGAPPEQLTCDNYCNVVMQNCTGNNAEYLTRDICVAMCPAFDVNLTVADTADNTLGCRLFHANAAALTPDTSCRFAGPLGGGHCGGDPCVPFCSLDVNYCSPSFQPAMYMNPLVYDGGVAGCEADCKTYPYLVVDAGDTTIEMGSNSLNCRLWHLETAYRGPAYGMIHCFHTALVSDTCH